MMALVSSVATQNSSVRKQTNKHLAGLAGAKKIVVNFGCRQPRISLE
jgi:hypothetical protein